MHEVLTTQQLDQLREAALDHAAPHAADIERIHDRIEQTCGDHETAPAVQAALAVAIIELRARAHTRRQLERGES